MTIFNAQQLLNPIDDTWAVKSLAPCANDRFNPREFVRLFDDTTEEAVGIELKYKPPMLSPWIDLSFSGRPETPPKVASWVGWNFYYCNTVDMIWKPSIFLGNMSIFPRGLNMIFTWRLEFSDLDINKEEEMRFELTRVQPREVGENLCGDYGLSRFGVEIEVYEDVRI